MAGTAAVSVYRCSDDREKVHKLVYDGGQTGNYTLELCETCYRDRPKKFLVLEEKM